MTVKQIWAYSAIELSKLQAPSLKLFEFNYLLNKAINQFVNKHYNIYDVNQQTTDDLRVLKDTAYLRPTKFAYNSKSEVLNGQGHPLYTSDVQATSYLSQAHSSISSLHGATYEVNLPDNYLHLLNCICIFKLNNSWECYDKGSYIQIPAIKLTADSWSQVVNDIYNRPSVTKPYFYIHNNSASNDFEKTYTVTERDGKEGDQSNFTRTFTNAESKQSSLIEKPTASRVSNVQPVRLEIRYGKLRFLIFS